MDTIYCQFLSLALDMFCVDVHFYSSPYICNQAAWSAAMSDELGRQVCITTMLEF